MFTRKTTRLTKLHANELFSGKAAPKRFTTPRTTRQFCCVCALLLLAMRSDGTSVAVFYSPTQIVVAADTLFIRRHKVGASTRFPVCKLLNVGNVFFASIGVVVDNPDTNFSLNDLGRSAAVKSKGVIASAQELMKISEAPIGDTISWLRKNQPAFYSDHIKGVEHPLGVVFVGFDNSRPVLAWVYFSVEERIGGGIEVAPHLDTCPGTKCPTLKDSRFWARIRLPKGTSIARTSLGHTRSVTPLTLLENSLRWRPTTTLTTLEGRLIL